MGAPSAVPLLLLLACCWAPGGANLSQDGEWGAGGARGGGCPRRRPGRERAGEPPALFGPGG